MQRKQTNNDEKSYDCEQKKTALLKYVHLGKSNKVSLCIHEAYE